MMTFCILRKWIAPALLAGCFVVSGPAYVAAMDDFSDDEEWVINDDPLEPLNRVIYRFNYTADGMILRPAALVYRGIVPEKGREMVGNALDNIYMPVVFANSVFQADPKNSFTSFWRFAVNTTFGIGGLFDVASETGLKPRNTDFGQTLAIYGVEPGPYIVLPIIGPSNGRDTIGHIADAFLNPFNYIDDGLSITIWSTLAVDRRASHMKLLDDIYNSSLDPYTTFRSGYTQHRAADIARARIARDNARRAYGLQ